MIAFSYSKASAVAQAVETGARHVSSGAQEPGTDFFAGGTDMMQLMQESVRNPSRIVDISGIVGMNSINFTATKTLLGASCRMRDVADHPQVLKHFPVVSQALLASASPQVRNLATLGGNLLQRTRCGYFRDVVTPCNKRQPGSGCPALEGSNRLLAILGTSDHCIATYAGDFANALMVLDAEIVISGRHGYRWVPICDLHSAPGRSPHVETQLAPGELITAIEISLPVERMRSGYLKVRDRTSFAFALASAAVAIELQEDGSVCDVRIAVGGVATKPWRLHNVEKRIIGHVLSKALCRDAASFASDGAVIHEQNGYKVELLKNTVARALEEIGGVA